MTTEDGYVLSLQRIPRGRRRAAGARAGQPVLMQHGVLVVSFAQLHCMHGSDASLPSCLSIITRFRTYFHVLRTRRCRCSASFFCVAPGRQTFSFLKRKVYAQTGSVCTVKGLRVCVSVYGPNYRISSTVPQTGNKEI